MAPPPLHLPPYLAPTWPSGRPRPAPSLRSPSSLHPFSDLLTEALGAESLDPDDVAMDDDAAVEGWAQSCKRQQHHLQEVDDEADQGFVMPRRTRSGRAFPPPISVIGKGGRPWLTLRAHREDGRLVLREMRLPSQELLQSCKEDGRFKLFMHPEAGGRCVAGAAGSRATTAVAQD
ncbi:hypothetical protein CFC21_017312 [Triticum aestivum]|uniref:FAF domain-containing protein n=3 Tax=Triticum TaxID=4564 RepID=A0A9R1R8I9_TRITD|nr:uncharacterized protein LOC119357909 [Triticum dicoccoides]XP_044453282.1 uncharacterized protein LOC123185466 [Triticum aestivum]KAF7001701.1 hypothetical protein CFC21_017312 [Triticum aestivum]VAH32218.1 unnamed protein product [Triticum turgidum subsp. durum]